MATAFPLPVTAAQVGTYFVGQYYQMLQNQPDFVHQFYNEASTMLRVDGNTRETANSMLQIHRIVLSLNYRSIEIKTAHSLESWSGGVIVMVSGVVHIKTFNVKRKFVQTFFLAPQEKGYFVLNDIFHYVDEHQILQHPLTYLSQSKFDSKLNASATIHQDQVSNYIFEDREVAAPAKIEENGLVQNYNYADEQLHHVPETEKIFEDNFSVQSSGSLQGALNSHFSPPIEEPAMEPQKHTYASIVAKAQPTPAAPSQSSSSKPTPESPNQPSLAASNTIERSGMENERAFSMEDEVEIKSVYVRNVPSTMAASEIAEEFRKFGKLAPEGVAIRSRKDVDICYAFVEFEDISGVQNAVQAYSVEIHGHQLYIEGRRPNRSIPTRGGGRGRGRGRVSYPMEGTRGRFGGRGFGSDRDSNRSRGNGYYRQTTRVERESNWNE